MKRMNQKGFHIAELLIVLIVVGLIGLVGYKVFTKDKQKTEPDTSQNTQQPAKEDKPTDVTWMWTGTEWKPNTSAPSCPEPLVFANTPSDLSKATSVLYPGQSRGGDFKPHGGLRFDKSNSDDITVKAIMDGDVTGAVRYIESGEVQYMFTIENDCGIAYRFDHLLTLSPEFQKFADTLPEPKVNETASGPLTKSMKVKAGDIIATAVGFKTNKNVGYDIGVYDYRKPNQASTDPTFAAAHESKSSQTFYAVCWFDLFGPEAASTIKGLPAGDQSQGKKSDYCK